MWYLVPHHPCACTVCFDTAPQPALVLWGRRWHIASDDLPLPAAVGCAFHLAWVVVLSVLLSQVAGGHTCTNEVWAVGFTASLLGLYVTQTAVLGAVAVESSIGAGLASKYDTQL